LVFAHIRHAAIDLARRDTRRAAREEAVAEETPMLTWFDIPVEATERSQQLDRAMRALPAEQQAVVTLKIWGELTFAEIAGVLDIPANTAASRYRLALESLRRRLPATVTYD
jgi:RNA polymerase sigma-70 factor (ECF subfamily)